MEKRIELGRFKTEAAQPSRKMKRKFNVSESIHESRCVFTIAPKENQSKIVIVYFHGGGYANNILSFHWNFVAELSNKTRATIIVPDYPLAPQTKCNNLYAFFETLLPKIATEYQGYKVVFMGDSAGGGLALGLAQYMRNNGKSIASQIIMLSPWLDVGMENLDMKTIDHDDKMLNIEACQSLGKLYAGELDLKDYRVSPMYGEFNNLGEISVFIGSYDILVADCRKFRNMLAEEHIAMNYYEYPKMFHVWVAAIGLRESDDAITQIVKLIKAE